MEEAKRERRPEGISGQNEEELEGPRFAGEGLEQGPQERG